METWWLQVEMQACSASLTSSQTTFINPTALLMVFVQIQHFQTCVIITKALHSSYSVELWQTARGTMACTVALPFLAAPVRHERRNRPDENPASGW
jgi:hypothetical protein